MSAAPGQRRINVYFRAEHGDLWERIQKAAEKAGESPSEWLAQAALQRLERERKRV